MLNISFPDQVQALAETQSQAAGFITVSDYLRHLILQDQLRLESSVVEISSDRLSDYQYLAEEGLQSVYTDEPKGLWESCLSSAVDRDANQIKALDIQNVLF